MHVEVPAGPGPRPPRGPGPLPPLEPALTARDLRGWGRGWYTSPVPMNRRSGGPGPLDSLPRPLSERHRGGRGLRRILGLAVVVVVAGVLVGGARDHPMGRDPDRRGRVTSGEVAGVAATPGAGDEGGIVDPEFPFMVSAATSRRRPHPTPMHPRPRIQRLAEAPAATDPAAGLGRRGPTPAGADSGARTPAQTRPPRPRPIPEIRRARRRRRRIPGARPASSRWPTAPTRPT